LKFFKQSSDNEIEKDFVDVKEKKKKNEIKNEFELDMDSSLNKIINDLSKKQEVVVVERKEEEEEDTDSEQEDATGERVTKKRQHFTNDELFYDPKMDDADEEWINSQRVTYVQYRFVIQYLF
jgi:DNA-binding protein H-NS